MTRAELIEQAVRNVCDKANISAKPLSGFITATTGYSWVWTIRNEFRRLAAQREAVLCEP